MGKLSDISYAFSQALIHAGLAEVFLIVWNLWIFNDFMQAATFTSTMLFFLLCFNIPLYVVLRSLNYWVRMLVMTLVSSTLVSAVLLAYPDAMGYPIEWYYLFGILLFAGILSHGLLYAVRMGGMNHEKEVI